MSICKNTHPAWHQPAAPSVPKLHVFNSLTESKEEFRPQSGNTVKMYICGPTVYDMSHMGHARAYLTFDILRRLLSDYFNYDVSLQMNITDIDDKIILKARKNELFRIYAEKHGNSSADIYSEGVKLLKAQKEKVNQQLTALKTNVPTLPDREKAEAADDIKKFELILEKNEAAGIAAEASKDSDPSLLALFKDLIADSLDKEHGASISDKQIFEDHARLFEEYFFKDMEALGVRGPDVVTRVTEFVPEIVTFIEQIIANGFAYESDGSVYFDTQKFKSSHDYPKLVPQAGSAATAAEMAEGEGALSNAFAGEKRHRNDFALWKKSKAGEPAWESTWGLGRPGWHIECSVMAGSVLGDNMDIHGGGADLKFPHHDNELAQSEARYGCNQWVNYFLHAGHLHIKGLKMSKSLKNFVTIKEALETFTARQIRLMFLLQQWDRPVNFSDQSIGEAKEKENRFNSFFARVADVIKTSNSRMEFKWSEKDFALNAKLMTSQSAVHSALCDNFNTPAAMESLDDIVSSVNTYLTCAGETAKPQLLNKAQQYVLKILRVFGVVPDMIGLSGAGQGAEGKQLSDVLDAFCGLRDQLRALGAANKIKELFQISDDLRDRVFIDLGVKIEDDVKKSRWSLEDPVVLRKEFEEKIREREEKKNSKGKK